MRSNSVLKASFDVNVTPGSLNASLRIFAFSLLSCGTRQEPAAAQPSRPRPDVDPCAQAPSRRQWIPVEAGEVYVRRRRRTLSEWRVCRQAQIGAKTGAEDAAASDLSSPARFVPPPLTMGVTPAASLSHGAATMPPGRMTRIWALMKGICGLKKIMLKLLVQAGSDAKVGLIDVVANSCRYCW